MMPRKYYDYFNDNGCEYFFDDDFLPHAGPPQCDDVWAKMQALTKDFNLYDLYRPAEGNEMTVEERMGKVTIGGEEKTYKRGRTQAE